jgi:hypothetical protein
MPFVPYNGPTQDELNTVNQPPQQQAPDNPWYQNALDAISNAGNNTTEAGGVYTAERTDYNINFAENAKNYIVKAVSNYLSGARQGINEMGRAQNAQMGDPLGQMYSGNGYQPSSDETNQWAKDAQSNFVNETALPTAVSDYLSGARQGINEMSRAQDAQMGDPLGQMYSGNGYQPASEETNQWVNRAEKTFANETALPTLAFVPGYAIPTVGTMLGSHAIDTYQNTEGTPLEKGGNAIRAITYGPAVDMATDPNIGQRFHDRPVSTLAEGVMAVGQAILPFAGAKYGLKKAGELKNDLVSHVENKLNEFADNPPLQNIGIKGLDALDQVDSPTRGFRPATTEEMINWNTEQRVQQQAREYGEIFEQQPQARFSGETALSDMPKRMQGEAVSPLLQSLEQIKGQKFDEATGQSYADWMQRDVQERQNRQNQKNDIAGSVLMSPLDRMEVGADLPTKRPYSGGNMGYVFGEQPQPRDITIPEEIQRRNMPQPESAVPKPFRLPTAEDLVAETQKKILDAQLTEAVNTRNYDAVQKVITRMQNEGIETPLSRSVVNKNIEYSKAKKPPSSNVGGFSMESKIHPANVHRELINDVITKIEQPKVDAFVDNALSERPQFKTMALRETTPHEVERIKNLTDIDTTGFKHEIDTNNLRHAMNQHGNPAQEAARNQLPLSPSDLKKIPEILNKPDNIKRGSDSGPHKSIIYEKREKGTTYYVETIMPSKGVLRSKTMWKKPSSADHAVSDPPYTSNAERSLTSSANSNIQHPGELFNGKDGKEYSVKAGTTENMRSDMLSKAHEAAMKDDYQAAYQYAEQAGHAEWAKMYKALYEKSGGEAPMPPKLGGTVRGEYTGDTISKKTLLSRAQEIFAPIRTGRIGRANVEGFVNHNTGVIRTRNYGDLDVASHEIGHMVDAALGLRGKSGAYDGEFIKAVHSRFGAEAYEPAQVRAEGIAEFFKDYTTNPELARKTFPKYYAAFEEALSKNPDIRSRVNEYRDMVQAWVNQSPEARGRSAVSQADERQKTFTGKAKDAWFEIHEKIYESKVGLAKFSDEIQKIIGRKLEVEEDPYKMARLANSGIARAQMLVDGVSGKDPKMIQEVLNKSYGGVIQHAVTIKSILEKLNSPELAKLTNKKGFLSFVENAVNKTEKGEFDYLKNGNFKGWNEALDVLLVARRQRELQNIHPDYKGPMSKADVKYIIENAPRELHEAAQECYKYNDNILRILAHEGMIKAEVYEALIKKYKNYVSMSREFADEAAIEQSFGMGKGYANVRNALKSISEDGSSRQVISPLESMIKNTYAMLDMVERNRVGKIFAEKAGEHGIGKLVEHVEGTSSSKDSSFSIWKNGEKHTFQTTPELYRAIMAMNQESANFITKLMSVPAGWLRAGATLTPDFALKNLSRDTFSALVFTRNGFIPVVDHLKGLASLIGKDDIYHEYRSSGALASTLTGLDRNYTHASMEKLMKGEGWKQYTPIELMRGFSEAVETMTRLGEYKKARGKGKSMAEAALSARDVTLDFSKSGTWGKKYNQITPFFNAAVQEPARIIQAFKENKLGTSAKIGMYIVAPSVLLWSMNHDQDWYKELPQYQKDLFWVFKAGDTICRIPKPFGLGVLFGSGTERMLDYYVSKDPQTMARWAKTTFDAFLPNIMPTVFSAISEWNSNYSAFLGRNIVPQKELNLPDSMQYGPGTSTTAKFIGEKLDLSPRKLDYLAQSLGGGMARQTLNIVDAVKGDRPYKNPLTTSFTIDPYKSPQSLQDFYDELGEAEKKQNAAKLTKAKLSSNEQGNYDKLAGANKGMMALNKQEREVLQSNLSEEQKRAKVSEINKRQMLLAQAVLKSLKR